MQKVAPSFARIAAMALFALSCFALLLFLWLAFGGPVPLKPKGYRITASFAEASQLAAEADVRISGVPVGRVKAIEPDMRTGRSLVTLEVAPRYAPLPADTRALLRQKTLLGETYVELTPGSARAPKLPEGGRLPAGRVGETVELDEILRTFDPGTRRAFQEWMQSQARAIGDRGRDLNEALGNLGPFADDAGELVDLLRRQQPALERLVGNTGVVFEALTERDGQLRELIEDANAVFGATGRRDRELREALLALPTFERETRRTISRLTAFARETDPLVTQLHPAARALSPALGDVAGVAPDLRALLTETGPLIEASRSGFPAAERVLEDLRPLLGQLDPALRQLDPILELVGLYPRELTAFLANSAAATQASTLAAGRRLHYLRTSNPLNPENLAVYPRRIGSNRTNPYTLPGHFARLRDGLPSYETRHCGRGVPRLSNEPITTADGDPGQPFRYSDKLFADILRFAFPGGSGDPVPAPACRPQRRSRVGGETTRYPRVKPEP